MKSVSLIFVLSYLVGCTPKAIQSTSAYEEDLSVHRPDFPAPVYNSTTEQVVESIEKPDITPTHHIKDELDSVLHSMILSKKKVRFLNGFSIQVYSGNNQELAAQIKAKVKTISEDFNPKIRYTQPNYKVKVGKYFSRIEANRDLVILKNEFSQALLVPARILIE